MARPLLALLGLASLLGGVACTKAIPTRPAGLPPTPRTVTKENPGGDAADPEGAALGRLLTEPWGWKRDRFDTLRVPLMDWTKWQRVKIWGHPTRASFRFGDEHYGVIALWYAPARGGDDRPESCLADHLAELRGQAEVFGVKIGETRDVRAEQTVRGEHKPIAIKLIDGSIETLVDTSAYVGGVAAYTSWPGTCLLEGFAVIATRHRDLALRIRERWLTEGVTRLIWEKQLTKAPSADTR